MNIVDTNPKLSDNTFTASEKTKQPARIFGHILESTTMTNPILSILALVDASYAQGAAMAGLDTVAIRCALSGRVDRLTDTAEALRIIAKKALPKAYKGGDLSLTIQARMAVPESLASFVAGCAGKCASLSKTPQAQRGVDWAEDIAFQMVQGFNVAYEKATMQRDALLAENAAIGKAKKDAKKVSAPTAISTSAPTAISTPAPTAISTPAPTFDLSDAMQIIEAKALMGDADTLNALQALIAHLETAGILEVAA